MTSEPFVNNQSGRTASREVWNVAQNGTFKVIPLKLFYYQTFFETWRNEHS